MIPAIGLAVYNPDTYQQWIVTSPVAQVIVREDRLSLRESTHSDPRHECLLEIQRDSAGRVQIAAKQGGSANTVVEGSLDCPIKLQLGKFRVEVFTFSSPQRIEDTVSVLPNWLEQSAGLSEFKNYQPGPATHTMACWFSALANLQRQAAGSQELFDLATRLVANPGGIDNSMILMKYGDGWQVASFHSGDTNSCTGYDVELLNYMDKLKCTVFHDSEKFTEADWPGLGSAVASPIFDRDQQCIGAVYASRTTRSNNMRRGIRLLEAQFVSLVADSITAGISRSQWEAQATRGRVLLEQAFPGPVAQQLCKTPNSLNPANHEITVMFCDIRNFTTIADNVSPEITFQFLADLMDQFTSVVMREQGVIIDYFGDGFSAFWNAPVQCPHHTELACRAAFDILHLLPQLNAKWSSRVQQEIKLGIGLHSGVSLVGNSGSRKRIKYGPRGSNVVLAQRIQDATKSIGAPLLLSSSTAEKVRDDFISLEVGRLPLKGFSNPPELVALLEPDDSSNFLADCLAYKQSWNEFQNRNWELAEQHLLGISHRQVLPVAKYLQQEIYAALDEQSGSDANKHRGSAANEHRGSAANHLQVEFVYRPDAS